MGIFDKFKNKKKENPDSLNDLTLSNLKPGYIVDYDLQTWEVTAYNHYDWGDEDITYEWQLKSATETIYLEREVDDEDYWSISKSIQINQIDQSIIKHISDNDNPPEEIIFDNITYYMDESGAGYYHKDRNEQRKELLRWDFADESGENLFTIEQWGEQDFQVYIGKSVEEYQFINILPGEKKSV